MRRTGLNRLISKGITSRLFIQQRSFSLTEKLYSKDVSESLNRVKISLEDTHNEETIRNIFDSPKYWNDFNKQSDDVEKKFGQKSANKGVFNSLINLKSEKGVGLFCNPYLTSPKGLIQFAEETLESARALTAEMVNDQSVESLHVYIKDLDRLSDMLCRVIDLCEFIRVVHPNSSFIKAAEQCHYQLFEHMNILNTSKPLFYKLEKVLYNKELNIKEKLSSEEISVGKLLYADFKKSGIDMDSKTGESFVQLSSYIANAGQEFSNNITAPRQTSIKIEKDEWNENDIKPEYLKQLSRGFDGSLSIPIYGNIPFELLRSCSNSKVREKIWVALHSSPDEQLELLTNLLRCREILANLMNCNNYSQYSLNDKMAKSPENVMQFLKGLVDDLKPQMLEELTTLYKSSEQKDKNVTLSDKEIVTLIKPWDREYLLTKHMISQKSQQNEDISEYFSLGTVVAGLSKLFYAIYGIKLVPEKLKKGEVWSDDVRRFNAINDKTENIGIIYLDLFQRRGKTPHPAHFTVCCSRRLQDTELNANDKFRLKSFPTTETIETVVQNNKTYQLPIISLVCNYNIGMNDANMAFLTLDQIATLFHEMGHAIHSMLGRTELHNVSGTRCQTDFVELPSILHETFARDERVLMTIGRHYKTGKQVPVQLLKNHLQSDKILKYCETFGQVKMALLDQIYHGATNANINNDFFNVIEVYHELESNLMFLADTKSTWPGKFGHLYSYGALYYSYLFDRAIASKIWEKLFKENPFSRESGEIFKNEVLCWGGSRDPWVCLSKTLNNEELAKGDVRSMEIITDNNKL